MLDDQTIIFNMVVADDVVDDMDLDYYKKTMIGNFKRANSGEVADVFYHLGISVQCMFYNQENEYKHTVNISWQELGEN